MDKKSTEAIGQAWLKAASAKEPEEVEQVCELDGSPFTMYYGQLQHQQNMLQDAVRTGVYQKAITENCADFDGATVLDVGTGTGLLAFFAAQAGARKVYAVEHAAPMAKLAQALVKGNHMEGIIKVVNASVEDSKIDEKVDLIVSEPIGFLLVHERMLESYVRARDMYLKPGGLMMPSTADIIAAPFSDETLWSEQNTKARFWESKQFYGIDLSALSGSAEDEYMSQAVVGYFSEALLLSSDVARHQVDFRTVTVEALQTFEIPLKFSIKRTGIMHGLGCWFDAHFLGSTSHVILPTGPAAPGTHWYQVRLLLKAPVAVNASQTVSGSLRFVASAKTSYSITMTLDLDGTHISSTNKINLQDQYYHYLSSAPAAGYDQGGYGEAPADASGAQQHY